MGKAPSLEEVHRRLAQIESKRIKVGLLQNAGSAPDGTPLTEIGAVHEFGSQDGRIPQRSWLRATFHRSAAELAAFQQKLINKVMTDQGMTVDRALGLLGQWVAARMKETIVKRLTEGPMPQANAQSTIDRKGSSTPLFDNGQLANAITYSTEGAKK